MAKKGQKPSQKAIDARIARQRADAELKAKLKEALSAETITDLEKKVLENWETMVNSDDLRLKALATKEVSKYLFAQKREHTVLPNITFNVTFEGIKDEQSKN